LSYIAINDVANLFFQIFGNGFIMALFIVMFFVVMLFIMRANFAAILIVILPLTLGLAFNKSFTNMIEFQPWIFYALLLAFGVIAGTMIIINALK